MNFTTCGLKQFNCDDKYIIDLENKTCTCKGFFYKGYCKHLKFFGVTRMVLSKEEIKIALKSLNFELNCLKANNKMKETREEYKIKALINKLEYE